MESSDVYRLLSQYNKEELFYRDLFFSRKDSEKYRKLIESVSPFSRRQLIIPELRTENPRPTRFRDDFLDTKTHKNVYLQKHNRYTPPYEHDHEFFEIIYVLSGQCENRIFGNTDILQQGDLCLMSPSVIHSLWAEDSIIIDILMRRSTIQNIFSAIFRSHNIISDFFTSSIYLPDFASCLIFRTDGDQYIRKQILDMFGEQLEPDEYSENIVSSMLVIFFNQLARRYKNTATYPQTIRKQNESVSRIMGWITEDFAHITLPDLAVRLGYSAVYCSRYIKKLTGCTFSELLRNVRLQKAQDLLQNTTMSIQEISSVCGYENPENFNRAFRRCRGMAPSLFRERGGLPL